MNDESEAPRAIREALRTHLSAGARELHRLKVALAELVLIVADADAYRQLGVARNFLESDATAADLADARQDRWTQIGSLACYCTPTDSLASQAILCCLEADESQHTPATLSEQVMRVLGCGVSDELVLHTLQSVSERHAMEARLPRTGD